MLFFAHEKTERSNQHGSAKTQGLYSGFQKAELDTEA